MRSFLFVPADSERKLARGPSSGPDGLILDLEDSVATDRKMIARDMALAYLKSADRAGPKLYVRVNALDTGLTLGDLAATMQGKPDGIVFPKCVGQADLDLMSNYLDALEAREGIERGRTRILTIATESAAAILALTAAPARHARLIGHSWGGEDLMADLGALAKGPSPGVYDDTFKLARTVNLMASVAAGVNRLRHGLSRHKERRGTARRGARCAPHGLWRQDRHPSRPGRDHPRGLHAERGRDRLGQPRHRHLRGQSRRRRPHHGRQDAGQAASRAGPPPGCAEGWMKDNFGLLDTLDRLFAGDRRSVLSLDEFLAGLEGRSYAFAILAVNVANVVPTGIPWLSTITGVPMLYLLAQYFAGRPVPSLPRAIGRRGLPRGKLQDFLGKARRFIRWLENTVHARREGWVNGLPRRLLLFAWTANVVILALPIPFDNLFPAWAILFFCFALIEDDGVMAILGWIMTVITAVWTVFLLMVGHAAISAAISTLRAAMFE